MPKSPICPRGWAISPSSLLVVRDNTLMQWLIGFNSLGEWNSSGNCFSPSLDMWSEVKRSEMKQTEFVSKYADNSAFIALYDWCERCSLYLQPPKVPQTFWCEPSSPYLQPQTVSQTVLMRTVFALFPTSKGSPNLWSYAEVGVKRSGERPF